MCAHFPSENVRWKGATLTAMCLSLYVNVPVCMSVLVWVGVSLYVKVCVHEFLSVVCVCDSGVYDCVHTRVCDSIDVTVRVTVCDFMCVSAALRAGVALHSRAAN